MISEWIREFLERVTRPIGVALVRARLSANVLTVLGTLVVAGGAWMVASGKSVAGGWVLLGGSVFDTLDGAAARASGIKSRAGAFLDSSLDRVSDAVIFGAVAWHLRPGSAANAGWGPFDGFALAMMCLVLGFLTSYLKARAEGLGFECNLGIAERGERVVIVILGLLTGLLVPALALLTAASAVTVVQRFVHVWKQARHATAE